VGFEEVVARLHAWLGEAVVIVLEPDGTVMRGRLEERDSAGIDGALFGLSGQSGVALALFSDAVDVAAERDGALLVRQGRVEIRVTPDR